MTVTIKAQLEECESYLFAIDQELAKIHREIKDFQGHKKLLLDINTTKTDALAITAIKTLNKLNARKARLETNKKKAEKIVNYYVPLVVRLNERANLSEDIELAAIEFYAEEEKDKA